MNGIAITAAALLTPSERIERPLVVVEHGRIVKVTSQDGRSLPSGYDHHDFSEATLVPGFLDIHIHGGAGHDVMEAGGDGLSVIQQHLARHGVTSYLPTTVTAPLDKILAALERLAEEIERERETPDSPDRAQAQPLGIHVEGPFLSHERRGVHPPENLLKPTVALLKRMWEASRGHIRVLTIAPELDGALEVIAEATRLGICVSLGHSDALLNSARAGFTAGARHATHTFNAMRPLNHREPGILGFVLAESRMTADIIADGIHVAPEVIDLFYRSKGIDKAVLITDGLSATGMPDGRYRLGAFEFEVREGRCTANGTLAGSVLTMDKAVRNVMSFAGLNLKQALPSSTCNPAQTIGVKDRGVLTAGAVADMVVLNNRNEVVKTIVRGRMN